MSVVIPNSQSRVRCHLLPVRPGPCSFDTACPLADACCTLGPCAAVSCAACVVDLSVCTGLVTMPLCIRADALFLLLLPPIVGRLLVSAIRCRA